MHSMTERYAFHGERAVFIDYLLCVRVNGMEDDLEVESATECLDFKVQKFLILARGIDVEWGGATIQTESAYHSYQTKHVIAVKVGNEHGVYLGEVEARLPYLLLSSLAAVNHEELPPYLHDL